MKGLNWLTTGTFLLAAGVMIGAFGAHLLEPSRPDVYRTASLYHFVHALGLSLVGILSRLELGKARLLNGSAWLMIAGILFFSGSLYVLATTGLNWLGAIAPIGGLAFIFSWILLGWATWKR